MECPQCGTRFNPMTTDYIFPMSTLPNKKTIALTVRKIKSPCCLTIISFHEDERVTKIFKKILDKPFRKIFRELSSSKTYKLNIINQIIELGYSKADAQKAIQYLNSHRSFLKIITTD